MPDAVSGLQHTEITAENTALTVVIYQQGLGADVMNEEWNNEFQYQITMSLVRRLKENGTISDNEYKQIDTIMLEKYRPILGTLLSGKPLN